MTYTRTEGPLPTLISCRHRLSDAERQQFKDAHNVFRNKEAKPVGAPVMAGSSISVETNNEASHKSYAEYGFSSLVVNDILVSRESISLTVLLKLQQMLDVEIITRKQIEKACKGYIDYVFSK